MRIVVSGGNGYVGRELCRLLMREHTVAVLDNFRIGPCRFLPAELERLTVLAADIRRPEAADALRSFGPDAVVHLAALHFIPECEADPADATDTNVGGTVRLAAACGPGTRFVLASSGAVYQPSEVAHHEARSTVRPEDVYGLTKLQAEMHLRHLAATKDLRAVVVRLFNVVGPGETNPHVLPEIVAQLKSGVRQLQLGNLTPRRDYIHVRDAAAGFAAVVTGPPVAPGETVIVNLGTSKTYSVQEVLQRLEAVAGVDFSVVCDPARLRPVDRPVLQADISAIAERFGWQPTLGLDDALRDLWTAPDLAERLLRRYAV